MYEKGKRVDLMQPPFVAGVGGGRGGYVGDTKQRFIKRGSAPWANPFMLLYSIFDKKGTPSVYFLSTNGSLFTYLESLELCIP